MAFKILAGVVAMVLMLGYLLAPVFKLKELDLAIAIILGMTLAVIDLVQSMKSKDD